MLSARIWLLLGAAGAALVVAALATHPETRLAALVAGATFVALILVIRGIGLLQRLRRHGLARRLGRMAGADASACFMTDDLGEITFQNAAAAERFGPAPGETLVSTLKDFFASPASVLFRLQSRARHQGSAREDVVTRRGHVRLSVHVVAPGYFLWRLEEFNERSGAGRGAETLSLPMLVVNKAGVVLFTNEAMRRLLGARPKRLDRVFTTPALHSGEEVSVAGVDGPVRAILAEVPGIGERREIYLLPMSEREGGPEMLADFEHVPVALIKFRADGSIRAANGAARDLTGIGPGDAVLRIHELFEGPGRSISDWMGDVLAKRVPCRAEVLRLRRKDEETFVQVTLRRVVERGRPGVLAVLQDATALKTLEAQFVQSQKMQAIGQLAGGIAHDFNNLLTAISGHCDLLLLRHAPGDPEYADLVQIHQNSNRAASLVGQLLAFSRKQTLKPEVVDLQDVLSEMTHLLNRLVGEKLHLQFSHAPDLGPIRADRRQLEQVVMNLVVNARDAMTEGGTIRIETEAASLDQPQKRNHVELPAGDYVVIRVTDTGCGIPPDRIEKIFEPFFTTKGVGKGTGLGLSTVYGIVKQSGGFIFVESAPGKGSRFDLYFPAHRSDPAQEAASGLRRAEVAMPRAELLPAPDPLLAATATTTRPGEGVILLVEDEAPVRAFASRALRLRGYTVIEAGTAEEALETLGDATLEVDVFVTDVVMPGMDGPSWVREARRDRPDVRVVFVSGYSEDCLTEEQDAIPNSVFLPKPFSLNDLTLTVQNQLVAAAAPGP
ncbi:ATP-binding protein [Szabonella alba]|uniref:histidine kinase n=1 Tax=Szabonella alba TaxID=2804194 RepID=A0A8K0V9K7_9RHOB|nr:ATP-binding protein [Szabonella alba]MBL4917636.1 response regulator [Szabonella alba]